MVKAKPLNFTIHKTFSGKCQYNPVSGYIHLPNLKRKGSPKKIPEDHLFFNRLIDSMTHEWFHKFLHENFGIRTSYQWDNIDKYFDREWTVQYCISTLIVYEWDP